MIEPITPEVRAARIAWAIKQEIPKDAELVDANVARWRGDAIDDLKAEVARLREQCEAHARYGNAIANALRAELAAMRQASADAVDVVRLPADAPYVPDESHEHVETSGR